MRKQAPAFILSSIVALASGSAFAFGDMNKNKKSPSVEATTPAMPPAATPPNTPKATGPANASEPGQTGNTVSGLSTDSPAMPSSSMNVAATTPTPTVRCEGLSQNDPNYQLNNCAATARKGGPGEGSGASSGSAGSPGN